MRCSDKYPFWFRKISKSLFKKKNLYRSENAVGGGGGDAGKNGGGVMISKLKQTTW